MLSIENNSIQVACILFVCVLVCAVVNNFHSPLGKQFFDFDAVCFFFSFSQSFIYILNGISSESAGKFFFLSLFVKCIVRGSRWNDESYQTNCHFKIDTNKYFENVYALKVSQIDFMFKIPWNWLEHSRKWCVHLTFIEEKKFLISNWMHFRAFICLILNASASEMLLSTLIRCS